MLVLLVKAISLCAIPWFLWQIFKQFIAKSPLDNIPGPPSKSWWKGVDIETELYMNDD